MLKRTYSIVSRCVVDLYLIILSHELITLASASSNLLTDREVLSLLALRGVHYSLLYLFMAYDWQPLIKYITNRKLPFGPVHGVYAMTAMTKLCPGGEFFSLQNSRRTTYYHLSA